MEELKIFENEEFGQVRTIVINNEPWFVGKDVASALGYANPKNAVPKHVLDEDKLSTQIEYAGQKRTVTVINESGLYALIFGSIREITIDGDPWFVGKDVAESLGYKNTSKALADHVEECDKLNNESLSSLGQRGGWLINESGLYALIFGNKLDFVKRLKNSHIQ